MVCTYCSGHTQVNNSRLQRKRNVVWRRRACNQCRAIFTTAEGVDLSQAFMVKHHDSHSEPFWRDKLFLSIYDSLRHRKTALTDASALTETVIMQSLSLQSNGQVESLDIARVCTSALQRFDTTASTHYKAFHPIA